ncbi:MAG: hypothetical protein HY362_04210 [Candidatus Aenigmarchaeota archaeon]|nr:hypothetical protein [Candidatus Aenigmarchaeota archaeon]
MDFPLCSVCLSSDMLCAGCNNKLSTGALTQKEVEISRFLHNLAEKHTNLSDAQLKRAVDSDILLLVAGKGHGSKLVGKGGAVVKALAKQFGKPIRVLEEGDFNSFLQSLLTPAAVVGINKLYTPTGEILRVRIKTTKGKPPLSSETFSNVAQTLFGKRAELLTEP